MRSTIVVSDLHIWGQLSRYPEIDTLCELLEHLKPDLLVLNGDIGDPWQRNWADISSTQSWVRLRDTCELRLGKGLETIWVKGNHDYNAKEWYLPGVKLCGEYQEGKFLFMHGWQFDLSWGGIFNIPGIAPLAFWLSRKAPWLMVPIYNLLFRKKEKTPSQQKHTIREDWNLHVGVIHLRARAYAQKKGLSIILGHTHCPTAYDGLIADDGDWVDSFTLIRITDVGVTIIGPHTRLSISQRRCFDE